MHDSPAPRRWSLGALIVGASALVGAVSASLTWSTWQSERLNVGLDRALLITMPYWLFWALITPVIWRLGERLPVTGRRWKTALAVHLLASVMIGLVHASLYMWANQAFFPFPSAERVPGFASLLGSYLRNRWQFEFLMYGAILGGTEAVRHYRGMQERTVRATQLESQLARAQLQALRMQLHPHFLFNTLQAISVLVVEDPRAAQRMLTQLGDLLRAVLESDERAEIPLHEELGFLERYLAIEQVRFADRLSTTFDVDPSVLDALVPGFVLQPLVENAIRYAIAPSAASGQVHVSARAVGGQLRLAVRDSGPGFPDAIDEGVGLSTTRARLDKLYGPAHRLSLGRANGGGAEAVIEFPLHREPTHG